MTDINNTKKCLSTFHFYKVDNNSSLWQSLTDGEQSAIAGGSLPCLPCEAGEWIGKQATKLAKKAKEWVKDLL